MSDATETQNNPAQGSGGEGADDRRLYAGKFKSPEELEKGYVELEKGFHETRQEVREVKELLTQRLPEPGSYGSQGRESYQPSPSDVNAQVLQAFYTNPAQVLVEVKEAAKREIEQERMAKAKKSRSEREVVERWKAANTDVFAKPVYQKLFAAEVATTDAKLPIESRLNAAAEATRKQILELRGHQERSPNSSDHREGPSGGEYGYSAGGGGRQATTDDPEAAFKAALAARREIYKPKPRQA